MKSVQAKAGLLAAGVSAMMLLSGCGTDATAKSTDTASAAAAKCSLDMALQPWVGYTASAYVVGEVAKEKLGCDVAYKDVKEGVAWQGLGSGDVDVIIENWANDDLMKQYVNDQKTAADAGANGNQAVVGWYVPPWMAEKYPDITDHNNLNKYAEMFKSAESGEQGQLLLGDPSFVTNDESLVKNLNLNYKVVYAGSEDKLIEAFRAAQQNKTPLIGYFYEPQWFTTEVPLVKVALPAYTEGCDADPTKVACDYPTIELSKVVATKFQERNDAAYKLVKSFQWTNADQNSVAKSIADEKMTPEAAAKKWIDANPDKVDAWLK